MTASTAAITRVQQCDHRAESREKKEERSTGASAPDSSLGLLHKKMVNSNTKQSDPTQSVQEHRAFRVKRRAFESNIGHFESNTIPNE